MLFKTLKKDGVALAKDVAEDEIKNKLTTIKLIFR